MQPSAGYLRVPPNPLPNPSVFGPWRHRANRSRAVQCLINQIWSYGRNPLDSDLSRNFRGKMLSLSWSCHQPPTQTLVAQVPFTTTSCAKRMQFLRLNLADDSCSQYLLHVKSFAPTCSIAPGLSIPDLTTYTDFPAHCYAY